MTAITGHKHEYEHAHGIEHSHEPQDPDHPHGRHGDHRHDQGHGSRGISGTIASIFHMGGHSHDHGEMAGDRAIADNRLGIRTI